jgi:limonene-1,2-epoxide hydrolase
VPGARVEVEVLETTVHGPVVVNSRIDTVKTTGKPDETYPVIEVFVAKNGKIIERSDYLPSRSTPCARQQSAVQQSGHGPLRWQHSLPRIPAGLS